jgi:FlaA1/EpsC-like NDP-sugar epimerase
MKNRYVLLAELPLIVIAALGAFTARFDWEFYRHRPEFVVFVLAALVVKPLVFWLFGMYRRYWQYASTHDMGVIALAVSAASLVMGVFVALAHGPLIAEFSRVVLFNDWVLTLVTAGGLRLAIRVFSESSAQTRKGQSAALRRILIVGAGEAGTMVAREMRRNPQLGMEAVGFLDDDPGKAGKHIASLRVLGDTTALPEVVRAQRVDNVIIAMPSARGPVVRTILDACNKAGVKSQAIPGVYELLDGIATVNRLRNVDIADLLRRAPVGAHDHAGAFAKDRVVLITGGGGSIGYELARQVANAAPAHLVLLGHGENSIFESAGRLGRAFPSVPITTVIADIRDDRRLAMVFDRFRPAIIFHAAAHKHVPLMEENPEEAITNNVIGTRNVVNQALRLDAERLVFISTDKAVAPTSLMGATKRIAEMVVREAAGASGRNFVVVRFGNVLGSRGSVVNTFKEQIERGGPVTVTHPDMTRYFMTIPEAVHLVLQASSQGRGGELFVLDMGEPVKIVQLAEDLIKLSGLREGDVPIVFTGVRTGEKLEESLFDPGMQTQATTHPEVLRVVGTDTCTTGDLQGLIWQLDEAARRGDRAAIEALLGQTIPGFVSPTRLLSRLVTDTTH